MTEKTIKPELLLQHTMLIIREKKYNFDDIEDDIKHFVDKNHQEKV